MNDATYRLGDERDRLDERLDELAERASEADSDHARQGIWQIARQVEDRLDGVQYLIDEYSADATVTVQPLTAGETARIEDSMADLQRRSDHSAGGLPGTRRNHDAAAALVDAPFLDDVDADDLDDCLPVVADLPTQAVKWLRARADDLSGIDEGNSKSFDERVAAQGSSTT